jgi:predicted metal-dependent phosphoesterase TrpH
MSHVRLGRADLHIHTLASDGVDGVVTILEHVDAMAWMDVIAIADHDRIDAALAARAIAESRGMPVRVIVGEEVSTRGGHILGLFLTERVPPLRSLRESIARIHDQGGIAVAAHPATPYPLCVTARSVRRLMDEPDPRHRLDAIEAFNPTTFGRVGHATAVRLSSELGLPAVGGSDAHRAAAIATGLTLFHGATPDDLRAAIVAGETRWAGTFHGTLSQLPTFGRQLAKYGQGWRDGVAGLVRGDRTGRDLGYPGGRLRPARFDAGLIEPPVSGGTAREAIAGDAGMTTPDGTGARGTPPDDEDTR